MGCRCMTTGSKTQDDRIVVVNHQLYGDGTDTPLGTGLVGNYYTKSWTGTNYPSTKPTYEHFSLRLPNGRIIKRKRRTDVPTRRKTEDHPYSCSIQSTRNSTSTLSVDRAYSDFGPPQRWVWYHDNTKYSTALQDYGQPTSVDANSEWNSNDDIALLGKLREKIAGSDFNAGVFLGEGREALKMIFNSATRIFKAYKAVRRGNVLLAARELSVPKPTKAHKAASANWLELQYGWLPLVKDAHAAAEFLAKMLEFPLVQTYKVRRKKPLVIVFGNSSLANTGVGYTRKQIIARLTEADAVGLSGLTDPASIVWELTPFSFVADWFIPIGNYLAARSLAQALTGSFVITKTRMFDWGYSRVFSQVIPPNFATSYETQGFKRMDLVLDRTVSTSLSVPLPSFKSLADVPSWKRTANSVALLTQLFSKHR